MVMALPIYYTAEMVRVLPEDGNRYEVVHGELFVTPAPRLWHQVIVKRLIHALETYLRKEPVGEVLSSPADISWAPDILVQPDVFVVPVGEARTLDWARVRSLLLTIEVLSPSTARVARFAKRVAYQGATVPLYWIVDGDERTVEVWTPNMTVPHVERERVTWWPEGARTEFELTLSELFRAV
jgi:Uma2 family endonuclease